MILILEGGKWRPRRPRRPRDEGAAPSADALGPSDGEIGALGRGLGRRTSARPSDERTPIGRGRRTAGDPRALDVRAADKAATIEVRTRV